jgi:hypothetical protein
MFRLNYSTVDDAFKLGSEQIKDVQEEIKKLKDIVLETSNIKPKEKEVPPEPNRIGKPDTVDATFVEKKQAPKDEIPGISGPNIEDIVKKYIAEKYPNFKMQNTSYEPSSKSTFKETFGEMCSNIKNMVIFFIVSIMVYILMSIYFDK